MDIREQINNVIVIHVIHEIESIVIGVASSRENALRIVKEYYGEHVMTDFKDVRENNVDFDCKITADGDSYYVYGECFVIDSI